MKLALLLLLAAPSVISAAAVLTNDIYQIPAGEWRWVRFEIGHRPATVECRFETVGGGEAQAELDSRPDLELFRQHKLHESLASTDAGPGGMFSLYIPDPGEYAVVIRNPGASAASVHLTVSLSFGPPPIASRSLSPTRRLTVILISFAAFFAIVTFSARALLRAMKR